MKITKPSELREGMRVKGKYMGLPISGYAKKSDEGYWFILPHYIVMGDAVFYSTFTELESVEGLMAMKEGDVLVRGDGDERKVFFCNEYIVVTSLNNDFEQVGGTYTYLELKNYNWKLKDQEQPEGNNVTMADIANAYQEIKIREIQQAVFKDIEDELFKHKFSTDMDGWQIVPQLTATMQILRSKYFRENQVSR